MEEKKIENKWVILDKIKVENAPEYIDKIKELIIEDNPNLSKISFEGDLSEKNQERLVKALNKLVIGIREFEEALLYI